MSLERKRLGSEMSERVEVIMLEKCEHGEQDPKPSQESGGGVRLVAFHLATAESNHDPLEFGGFRRLVCLQLPDYDAGYRRNKQTTRDGRSCLLLPLFHLLAVALEQLEVTLYSPSPVVAPS
jgi:hypothetical protein